MSGREQWKDVQALYVPAIKLAVTGYECERGYAQVRVKGAGEAAVCQVSKPIRGFLVGEEDSVLTSKIMREGMVWRDGRDYMKISDGKA